MSKWPAVALGAPGCLLAAASLVSLALAAFGRYPMWPHEPVNLAEAAGVRDEAEVVRLIEDGADPNARYSVRPGFGFDGPTRLTPLEAAIAADDPMIVRWLLARGTPPDADRWTYLRCIAGGDDVPPLLDQQRPPGAELKCDGVRYPWQQDD